LAECAAVAVAIAGGVGADHLCGPTPCAEFDVRALVNHWILVTSHGLLYSALRQPVPEELTTRDFTAGSHWAEEYAAQLDRAVAAWSRDEVWDGYIDLSYDTMPASEVAESILAELAIHGWDIAQATGQPYRISADSARLVRHVVRENSENYRQYRFFAAPYPAPTDADAFIRALAESGRDPRWAPDLSAEPTRQPATPTQLDR
jgi:uncharacterized protein (TIGR03086 family)